MVFELFNSTTANDAWISIAQKFIQIDDVVKAQNSRVGMTREILHAAISISDPRQRWVYSRIPAINPAFALAEVIWILSGRNDTALIQFFNREITKYCGNESKLHGAYGYRLRNHFTVDQLSRAKDVLKNNPDSRQVALQIWDSESDLPLSDGLPRNSDIPCNVISLLKVRDSKLEWTQILRSNDVFRGVPYNWVQFTTIQEIMAGWLGLEVGSYNHMSDSLHVYMSDLSKVKSYSEEGQQPINTDNLALAFDESKDALVQLEKKLEVFALIKKRPDPDEVNSLKVPNAYKNILRVIAAEAARRHGSITLINEIMSECTNPCLVHLWNSWINRLVPSEIV